MLVVVAGEVVAVVELELVVIVTVVVVVAERGCREA
jgi:hypothetical protein